MTRSGLHEDCPGEELLTAFFDGELDASHVVGIERHVARCSSCASHLDAAREVRRKLLCPGVKPDPPPDLERRILRQIGLQAHSSREPTLRRSMAPWRAFGAGAALAASITALAVLPIASKGTGSRGLSDELVASHVRSLMVDHITDVTTSDQHLVKPWFNGKLDFSPPVPELAARGFPLSGGRLDLIENRPVAVLVYKRRLHEINLFIWSGSETLPTQTRDGFNILGWRKDGMVFFAVSDLNREELAQFATAFQTAQ